jgi:hypothetical protein
MRRGVDELRRAGALGVDHQVGRHGKEAEYALADRHVGMARFHDVAESHGGNPPPPVFGGEEAPVVEHVSGCGVGDVVRREGKAIDPELDLPGGEVADLGGFEAGLAPVVPADQEAQAGRVRHRGAPARLWGDVTL